MKKNIPESSAANAPISRLVRGLLVASISVVSIAIILSHVVEAKNLKQLFDNIHWTLAYGTGASLSWLGYRTAPLADKPAIRWFAIGLSIYTVGQIVWDIQVAFNWLPFPGPSDLFFICLGPCLAIGFLRSFTERVKGKGSRIFALDVLGPSIAIIAVTLAFYLPRRGAHSELQLAVLAAYPIALWTAASMCLGVILAIRPRFGIGWPLAFGAVILNGIIWLIWNSLFLEDKLQDGAWLNMLFSLGAVAQGFGALYWRTERTSSIKVDRFCDGLLNLQPLLIVVMCAIAVGLTSLPGVQEVVQVSVALGAAIVVILAMVRQSLMLSDVHRLHEAELQLNKSEEKFRLTLDLLPIPVGISEFPRGKLVDFNRAMNDKFGPFQDGKPDRKIWVDRNQAQGLVELLERDGKAVGYETTFLDSNGLLVDALVFARIIELDGAKYDLMAIMDITDRIRSEEAVRRSEEQYRALVNEAVDGIFTFGTDGIYLDVNPAGLEMLQLTRQEILGSRLGERSKEHDRVEDAMRRLLRGETTQGEWQLTRKDGSELWAEIRSKLQSDGRIQSIYRDVTERKKIEAALRESEERYRAVVEQAVDGMFILSREGVYLEINAAGAHMLQMQPEEILGRRIGDLSYILNPERVAQGMERVLAGETVQGDVQLRKKDGTPIWTDFKAKMLVDGRIHGVYRDIHDQKLAEEAMRASEERTQQIVSTTLDAVVTMDRSGIVTGWNYEAERIFGRTSSEAIGNPMVDLIVPPSLRESHRGGFKNYLATGVGKLIGNRVEIKALRANGEEFPVELALTAIGSGEEIFFSAFIRDLTEIKQAEEAKKALESQLRQSQKLEAVGTLAAGIAHDFNNILSAIRGNAELISEDLTPDHPARESLQEIKRASKRATYLVQQIVAFARKHQQPEEVVDIPELVDEITRLLKSTLPANVRIVTHFDPKTPKVFADPTQLHQVLVNLATNAWQAMESRPGQIDIKVGAVKLPSKKVIGVDLPAGHYAHVQITDTGKGMDEQTAERIFEPFFTTKVRGQGTGLGLSVVHSIVGGHGGAITLETALGKGTTFHVYLPASGAVHSSPEVPEPKSHRTTGSGEHVVYVDDEDSLVLLVKRGLERRGFKVSGFTSAEEALEALKDDLDSVDAVITDYNMPRMSGIDFAKKIGSLRPELPVILTSGYVTDELRKLATSVGIRDVIYKPDSSDELCEAVARFTSTEAQV